MLVELSVVDQRYQEVLAVIRDGVPVVEFGVSRQAIHRWLRWYEGQGLPGLVDRSHRLPRCSHQMVPAIEVWVTENGVVPVDAPMLRVCFGVARFRIPDREGKTQ
jgi:hypothetical protein